VGENWVKSINKNTKVFQGMGWQQKEGGRAGKGGHEKRNVKLEMKDEKGTAFVY